MVLAPSAVVFSFRERLFFHYQGLRAHDRITCFRALCVGYNKRLEMDYRSIITIEPDKMGGKPCIRGLRITVYDVLDYLASGMTEAEILADFPDLTREDIRACLAFAADRERRLLSIPV